MKEHIVHQTNFSYSYIVTRIVICSIATLKHYIIGIHKHIQEKGGCTSYIS